MKNKQANKHPKRKIAAKKQTQQERASHGIMGSVFNSLWWLKRLAAIRKKLAKKAEKRSQKKARAPLKTLAVAGG